MAKHYYVLRDPTRLTDLITFENLKILKQREYISYHNYFLNCRMLFFKIV